MGSQILVYLFIEFYQWAGFGGVEVYESGLLQVGEFFLPESFACIY
jgi:hypothetical protein